MAREFIVYRADSYLWQIRLKGFDREFNDHYQLYGSGHRYPKNGLKLSYHPTWDEAKDRLIETAKKEMEAVKARHAENLEGLQSKLNKIVAMEEEPQALN